MSQVYEIGIERAILSTIIFDSIILERAIKILKPNDFYLPSHKDIYETMLQLNKQDLPIDEEFIRIKCKNQNIQDVLLEILSTTPISNIEAYATQIRNYSLKRELAQLANQIKIQIIEEEASPFDVLVKIEERLSQIAKENTQDFLQAQTLDTIIEKDTEYICKNFVPFPKNSVSVMAAKGGTGKTWTAIKIADEIIKEDQEQKVLIIATEDQKGKLKSRANKLNINSKNIEISDMMPFAVLEKDFKTRNWKPTEEFYKFKNAIKKYTTVIIDPLIAFYSGEENSNGDARIFMQQFTNLCKENNITIILIHHTDKDGKGSRGAGAFADASRLTYYISKDYTQIKEGEKTTYKELNNNKLRFEVQKENDNIESIKKLDPITKVNNIGSFAVEIFPTKPIQIEFETNHTKQQCIEDMLPSELDFEAMTFID